MFARSGSDRLSPVGSATQWQVEQLLELQLEQPDPEDVAPPPFERTPKVENRFFTSPDPQTGQAGLAPFPPPTPTRRSNCS